MKEFGSIGRLLRQSDEAKRRVLGDDREVLALLSATRDTLDEALRSEIIGEHVHPGHPLLRRYLLLALGSLSEETLHVLFLDSNGRLVAEEQIARGSVATVSIYPRMIFRRALELGVVAVILAHNHPSGDARPSEEDIRTTQSVFEIGKALDVVLTDHLIVAGSQCVSMRDLGLLP